jgi:4-hydroxy-3-polyprenylbenzoate decarboxylase
MKRLIVAITGASGAIYGVRALQALRATCEVEVHLVISPSAARTLREETDFTMDEVKGLADIIHNHKDIGASIASGSFKTAGMIVAPCSVKTLSGIANCYDEDLVIRAADVCLKERRRVVLLFRETPLHAGHISLMDQATRSGAIIMPPIPSFYNRPVLIEDIVNQSVGRMLDMFDLGGDMVTRWAGTSIVP